MGGFFYIPDIGDETAITFRLSTFSCNWVALDFGILLSDLLHQIEPLRDLSIRVDWVCILMRVSDNELLPPAQSKRLESV